MFEAGDAGGVLFIAMRYVRGGDVRTLVTTQGPLLSARVAAIISPVASALDAAHEAGLVHRDVKPANMLLDARSGRPDHVYLSDFGLSKGSLATGGLTGTGQFLGTLDYIAPEQIEGKQVDGRADQYSLACAAFELLTGAPPFVRDQALAVMYAQLSEPPPLVTSRRPDLLPAADRVFAKALAKAAADRYASCREFSDAMRAACGMSPYDSAGQAPAPVPVRLPTEIARPPAGAVLVGQSTEAGPAAPRRTKPRRAQRRHGGDRRSAFKGAGAGVAILALAGIAVAVIRLADAGHTSPPAPGSPAVSAPVAASSRRYRLLGPLVGQISPGFVGAVAFSPGGSTLAVGEGSDSGPGGTVLWEVATGSSPTPLIDPGGAGVQAVAFSPDGQTLAVGDSDGATYLWDVATEDMAAELSVPQKQPVTAVAFSPDGKTLAAGDANGTTYLWDVTFRTMITKLPEPAGERVQAVAFSPDGKMLAVGDSGGTTYLWDVATGTMTTMLHDLGGQSVQAVAFSPDGKSLAAGDVDGTTYLWHIATQTQTSLHDPDTGSAGVVAVAFSPDGGTLAAGDSNGRTYLWDVATGGVIRTLPAPANGSFGVQGLAFSPDGSRLAVGDVNGNTYLWKVS